MVQHTPAGNVFRVTMFIPIPHAERMRKVVEELHPRHQQKPFENQLKPKQGGGAGSVWCSFPVTKRKLEQLLELLTPLASVSLVVSGLRPTQDFAEHEEWLLSQGKPNVYVRPVYDPHAFLEEFGLERHRPKMRASRKKNS